MKESGHVEPVRVIATPPDEYGLRLLSLILFRCPTAYDPGENQ